MKRFALTWANLIDNEIEIHLLEGTSAVEVARKFMNGLGWTDLPGSLEDLKDLAFNGDCLFAVKEIPSTTTSDE